MIVDPAGLDSGCLDFQQDENAGSKNPFRKNEMTMAGSFVSEAYACGSNYYFSAQFNRFLWSAQITTSMGFPLISISRTPPGSSLEIESAEEALADWVYQTLCNHLQAVALPGETAAPVKDMATGPLYPSASNSPCFCSWSPERDREYGSVKIHSKPMADAATLRNLKDRSITAIERFKDRAVQFDQYRTRMRLLFNE